MTVAELIEQLQGLDPTLTVKVVVTDPDAPDDTYLEEVTGLSAGFDLDRDVIVVSGEPE